MDAKSVAASLRARRNLQYLGQSQLAQLTLVTAQLELRGHPGTPAARGLVLRQVLLAAVEHLRPAASEPNPRDPRWYPYLILTRQYVGGEPVEVVRQALSSALDGLPLRTYHRYRRRALEELSDVLLAWDLEAAASIQSVGLPAGVARDTAPITAGAR